MKYEYECFSDGTPFEHRLGCVSHDDLIISAFWHLVSVWCENPYIGGMSAVGNGELTLDLEKPGAKKTKLYRDYVEEKKAEIVEFWTAAKI